MVSCRQVHLYFASCLAERRFAKFSLGSLIKEQVNGTAVICAFNTGNAINRIAAVRTFELCNIQVGNWLWSSALHCLFLLAVHLSMIFRLFSKRCLSNGNNARAHNAQLRISIESNWTIDKIRLLHEFAYSIAWLQQIVHKPIKRWPIAYRDTLSLAKW